MATPLPTGLRLVLDSGVRRRDDGRALIGGTPRRVMRLSEAGVRALAALEAGDDPGPAGRALGRSLTDAGIAHPRPEPPSTDPDVTVVIPVRDRPAALDRCLGALDGRCPVVVVDDGSVDPDEVVRIATAHGATVVRRAVAGGPGVARNDGLAAVTTALVGLLDSDCVPPADWLRRMAGHFADPTVAAVAPRIRATAEGTGFCARYAAARAPLDMGTEPRSVQPGGPVSYVPTAALLVRRTALDAGFDPALRYGEDVDLVWRMRDAGWRVRFDPAVEVRHCEPESWRALLVRRYRYGTSAGPLARRHGARLAPVALGAGPMIVIGLVAARRPRTAVAMLAAQSLPLAKRLSRAGVPPWWALVWKARAVGQTLDGLGRTTIILGAPVAATLIARRPRTRGPLVALTVGSLLADWVRSGRPTDPLRWTVAAAADDLAYGAGVWRGAIGASAPRAVLPKLLGPSLREAVSATARRTAVLRRSLRSQP